MAILILPEGAALHGMTLFERHTGLLVPSAWRVLQSDFAPNCIKSFTWVVEKKSPAVLVSSGAYPVSRKAKGY